MRLRPRTNDIVLRPSDAGPFGEPPTNHSASGRQTVRRFLVPVRARRSGSHGIRSVDGKTSVRANYRLAYDRTNTFVFSSFIFQSAPGLTRAITCTNNHLRQNGRPVAQRRSGAHLERRYAACNSAAAPVLN